MLVWNKYNFMETRGWLGQRWGRNLRLILKGCISLKGMLYLGLTGGQLESMAVGVGLRNAERLCPVKKLIKRGGTSTECEREPYKKEKTPSNKQCITKRKRWQQAVENSHRVPHHHAVDFSQDALHTHTHTAQIVTIVFKCIMLNQWTKSEGPLGDSAHICALRKASVTKYDCQEDLTLPSWTVCHWQWLRFIAMRICSSWLVNQEDFNGGGSVGLINNSISELNVSPTYQPKKWLPPSRDLYWAVP